MCKCCCCINRLCVWCETNLLLIRTILFQLANVRCVRLIQPVRIDSSHISHVALAGHQELGEQNGLRFGVQFAGRMYLDLEPAGGGFVGVIVGREVCNVIEQSGDKALADLKSKTHIRL